MSAKVLKFVRSVNGVNVEQRVADGYINGTAMCQASGKLLADYLRLSSTQEYLTELGADMGIPISALARVRKGGKSNEQGTWVHPEVAVDLGQWCSTRMRIAVNRWVVEWLATAKNPVQANNEDLEQEWQRWQQRYDIRIELKDFLRPELMNAVVRWAEANSVSPITLCSAVHDAMNERIQGAKARQIRLMGGLPLGVLLRDHFGAAPLTGYAAINRIAKNGIDDRGLEPVQAVHEACDCYLGKAFIPKLVPIAENLYSQGRKLKAARQNKKLRQGIQLDLTLWDSNSEPQVS